MRYLYVLILAIAFCAFPLNAQNAQTDLTYLDSLNNLYKEEADKENYSEAIRINLEALSYCKRNIGKKNLSYVRFLNNLASCYYNIGNYEEVINVYERVLKIEEKILSKSPSEYATSLNNLALCYYEVGDYEETIKLCEKVLKIGEQVQSESPSEYATSLKILASCYDELGNNEGAIKLYEKLLEIEERILGKTHPDYGTSLSYLALYYSNIGNYDNAIRIHREVLTIVEDTFGKMHPNYATSLSNLALCYFGIGNYDDAIKIHEEALSIREKALGKMHPNYATSLANLAACYFKMYNYNEAIKFYNEALTVIEGSRGKACPDYARVLWNLAACYHDIKNYEEAIALYIEELALIDKALGKIHPDYATSLDYLAACYLGLGNYDDAIEKIKEALIIKERTLGKAHPDYAISLNGLAVCYTEIGNYDDAIKLHKEALTIIEESLGETHPNYATAMNGLAVCFSKLRDYDNAIKLFKEVLTIREKSFGKTHPTYATSLNDLAVCYFEIGNYEEAIKLSVEALTITEDIFGETHPDFVISLSNLVAGYSEICSKEEVIELHKEILTLDEKIFGKHHPSYASSLNNLAWWYSNLGNYEEAIILYMEALTIIEKSIGKTHPDYVRFSGNLARCYSDLGNHKEAINLYIESLNIIEKEFAQKHPDYIHILNGLCTTYYKTNRKEDFIKVFSKYFELKVALVKDSFSTLNARNRYFYWKNESDLFNKAIYNWAYNKQYVELNESAYNSALISKGIILDTEIEFSKLIAESKDEEALRIYKELQHTRTFLNKQYEKPVSERVVNTDSLETVAEELEELLIERSQVYGDFTRNLSIDWKQVQKKLGKDDIAIEFVSFSVSKDSTMYCALTLKKGYDAPKLIPLFEEHQLDSVNRAKCYESTAITELVWKPLDEELKETKNIYFAPDGELYNIAIESLPYNDGEGYVFDRWNLHRLSSTRELAKIKNPQLSAKAVLYGGLRYNTDVTMLKNSRQESDELYASHYRSIPDSIGLRGTYKYLPGTLYEIEGIEALYSNRNIPSIVYKDILGSETSVKKLDGQKVSNLHIATHGFYWTETELNEKEDLRELPFMRDNNRPRFVEDKAMTRSGLLFAGANHVLSGKSVPEGYDDGILTAKEISTLDLRGLDLLVLSACQTGLGESKGDGVYGLQRGFKMAGAQTIVMSLWKVDDDATQLLMTEFYKRYLSGQSKHDAFLAAQEAVRNFKGKIRGKDRNFSDPKYWAGFVMLD